MQARGSMHDVAAANKETPHLSEDMMCEIYVYYVYPPSPPKRRTALTELRRIVDACNLLK